MTASTALRGRQRIASLGAMLLLLACVAACEVPPALTSAQAGAAGRRPVTIGFSPLNQTNPLLVSLGAGLRSYAASKGAQLVVADPGNDARRQVQQLTDWIEHRKVQAIWALPVDARSLIPVFAKARANGIVVLATGTPADYGQADLDVGTSYSFIDYVGWGEDVGRALGECADARLKGRARALYLHNPTGTVGMTQFGKGLRKGLAATSPDSSVIVVTDNKIDEGASRQATVAAIGDAGINAVVAANDDALIGAVEGLTRAGRSPVGSCVVGAGGSQEALNRVHNREIYAVAALGFQEDITQNVDQLLYMVADPRSVGLQLLTPVTTIRQ